MKRFRIVLAALAVALTSMVATALPVNATEVTPNNVSTSVVLDCTPEGFVRANGLASNLGPATALDVTMTFDSISVGPLHISAVAPNTGSSVQPTITSTKTSVTDAMIQFNWDNGGSASIVKSKDCPQPPPPPPPTCPAGSTGTPPDCITLGTGPDHVDVIVHPAPAAPVTVNPSFTG